MTLAGTYLHLLLAQQALSRLAAEAHVSWDPASFNAGVLGPDIGYFPGGPRVLSNAVHESHTADLVRSLHQLASDPAEAAFAAGWSLHVYTDLAVHPQIDQRAAQLQMQSPMPAGTDSWHKRIEWGLDCKVLDSSPKRLWNNPLRFPVDGAPGDVLQRSTAVFFEGAAQPEMLLAGAESTTRWVRRLAPILAWTGGTRRPDRHPLCRWSAPVLRPLARGLARWWTQNPARDDEVAILNPLRDDEAWLDQLLQRAYASIEDFLAGWRQDHRQLENRHLSTGEVIATSSGDR